MAEKLTWEQVGKSRASPILSPAFSVGDLVFTAGSVGAESDGSFTPSVERQTELALAGLETVLKASGSSLDYVVKALVFIKNPEDQPKMNQTYAKIMKAQPARSCVVVKFPNPNILVEIECIAVKNGKPKL